MNPLLSVLIPVYNEVRTVGELLRRVDGGPYPYPEREVIVIDDGSTDGTADALRAFGGLPGVTLLRHPANRGKGAAVRTGLAAARGEVVIVQDADLEYDPQEYPRLVGPILDGTAAVVYGSRYLAASPALPWTKFRAAVVLLNRLVWLLYGQRLTDEATCYKAVRADLLRSLDLRSERFELCAEITAKLCRLGVRIAEVPISYRPRDYSEGKKIGWRDAVTTFRTLLKWRFLELTATPAHPAPTAVPGSLLEKRI